MSNKRRDRRSSDPNVQQRREKFLAATPSSGRAPQGAAGPLATVPSLPSSSHDGSGWAVGGKGQTPATGSWPTVNPYMIPKNSGLNVISQTYPSNYFVEWTLETHRIACDRAIKQGFTPDIATLYSWVYESSPFVQSMFRTIDSAINSIPFYFTDEKGNVLDEWTKELCGKPWHQNLRREIAFSFFWGFTGLNFDPISGRIYKYPMQQIDPLNRLLKQATYSPWDGVFFDEMDNLLFIQPNTNYEAFLGWMQAIARMFIQMNLNDSNWIAAGKKLAFPIFTIGYPEGSNATTPSGMEVNPYREEAIEISKNIGPGSAVVFPYVKLPNGEIQKNIEIQFEQTGASQKAHSIYLDFNTEKKNEIREMILGGTLTADVGDSGSRALGEVQERKLKEFLKPVIEFVLAYLNDDYIKKISKFYDKFPKGQFDMDRAKRLTIEEIVAWSGVLQASGKQFTGEFFEQNGFAPEFIEDRPEPVTPDEKAQPLSKKNDGKINSLGGIKKNYLQH